MCRSWWVCLLALLALGAGRAGAAEKPYVIKVGPTLVYLDVGSQQGATAGDIYAVVRPEEEWYALVGLVTLIRVEEQFSIAEIGYRAEGEQFEILQRAMPLKEWEAQAEQPRAESRGEEEARAEEGGHWTLQLTGGTERSEGHNERTLGLALGTELGERFGLGLGFEMAGGLLSERTQYIGELNAEFFPFGSGWLRPYLGGGPSLRRLQDAGQSALKWGGQVLGGVELSLGRWRVRAEGGYQRVVEWSGVMDASGGLGQVGVGVGF